MTRGETASKLSLQSQWAMVAIILFATWLRFSALERQSITFDEAYSFAVGSASWPMLFHATLVSGVHPPLFYIIYKLALSVGGIIEFGGRSPTVMFGLLAIPAIYRLGAVMFNRQAGLLAAALLAINPIHVWLSQEARMYVILILLAIGSMFFFWQAFQKGKMRYWIGLLIVNALAFNLHYFSLWLPVIQLAVILTDLRRFVSQFRLWVATQFVAGLFLLPWLIATTLRESQSFGIGFLVSPTLLDLPLTLWNFTIGLSSYFLWPVSILSLALFTVAFLNGLRWRQKKPHLNQWLLIFWIFLPLVFVWIISQRRAFYADRYLSFIIPGLVLLVAFGAVRINSLPWRNVLVVGLVAASGYGLVNIQFDPTFLKDNWRDTVAYLVQNEQPDDIILIYNNYLEIPFGYHYQGELPHKPITRMLENQPIEPLITGHRRAWVLYHYGRRPTHYPMQPLRPNGYWDEDPDRNPLLADWLKTRANNVADYRHFRGLELWLIDLE